MIRAVCQHCYAGRGIYWGWGDDERWRYGEIICPHYRMDHGSTWGVLHFKDEAWIHELCPFALEQLVLRQGKEG